MKQAIHPFYAMNYQLLILSGLFCLKFVFDFLNRRQAPPKIFRQSLSQFIIGYPYRFLNIAQGIFGFDAVLGLAEQKADSAIVTFTAEYIIHGGTVEVELAVIIKFNGFLQIAGSPMISKTLHHIPITGSYILDLFHQDKVICPIQMLDGESKIIPI